MKTTLSMAFAVLLCSVPVAEATPIRGYFKGVVTFNSFPSTWLPYPEGTPAWAVFGYDSDYLSPPDAFGNRNVFQIEEAGSFFAAGVADVGLVGFTYDSGGFAIGPNGLPIAGSAAGPYDSFVFSNGFAIAELGRSAYLVAEGTYSLPDHESALLSTVIGLVALGFARRFL
jgi:hypothetical protein